MKLKQKYLFYKKMASFILVIFCYQFLHPIAASALTNGPSQPEFSGFEPVSTSKMVNEFTGDFTYNLPILEIPGPNGGGYSLSLSYHSGVSPEEEASWVGYGWTLNPGAIIRNKRGFPDDWNGKNVTYWNKMPTNETISIGPGLGVEIFSLDLGLSANAALRYNNYRGFGYNAGVGLQLGKGVISLGYNVTDGEGSFSAAVNPAAILNYYKSEQSAKTDINTNEKIAQEVQKYQNNLYLGKIASSGLGRIELAGSRYGLLTHSSINRPTQITGYKGESYNMNLSVLATFTPLPLGFFGGLTGSYTWQKNTEYEDLKAYGYMYSSKADSKSMMDYYIEKGSTYNKRDVFLSIPFSSADIFTVTGEGLSGGFRMYNKKAGHFSPNEKKSETDYINLGVDVEVGGNIGAGAKIGAGVHKLEVKAWNNLTSFADVDSLNDDEPIIFRFNSDLGGSMEFGSDDDPQCAKMTGGGLPMFKEYKPGISNISTKRTKLGRTTLRSGRSSYIGHNTNADMIKGSTNSLSYLAYTKNNSINEFIMRSESAITDQIGEFTVVNEDGVRYIYGLPVYSRNERNLHFGLQGLTSSAIHNNYLAYKDITNFSKNNVQIGEVRNTPYASMYLLTSITDSDYIDRLNDGPTDDDFGGWTKFTYKQIYGSKYKSSSKSDNWYKWRVPYNGLLYNRNELSDPNDDMGSYVDGEKEVYYLKTIETKTHIAVFEISDRLDGLDASHNDTLAAKDPKAKGKNCLKKLDRIKLYAKNEKGEKGELIKTVNLEYDYSLANGIPNTSVGQMTYISGVKPNRGKLTLKKVWFEYGEILEHKISPYNFEYEYCKDGTYPEKYKDLDNYGNYSSEDQNPNYSKFDVDVWGNYQYNGAVKHAIRRPWMTQNPHWAAKNPNTGDNINVKKFDPAAWHLKVIKLPSGGEIHVQYEQDDYCYVQNQQAHSMVSLMSFSSDNNSYYLNTKDFGIDPYDPKLTDGTKNPEKNTALKDLKNLIQSVYVNKKEKMYFKFLYKLIEKGTPTLSQCNAEYITGYVNVKEVNVDSKGLYVKLGGVSSSDYDLPQKVCQDLVETQKLGKLSSDNTICDASVAGVSTDANDPMGTMMSFLNFLSYLTTPGDLCKAVNFEHSYLRVPVPGAKKGGGLRVKRLLLFDRGIEKGDESLYGSEFLYQTKNMITGKIRSSGVAANEPQAAREENILVKNIQRLSQSTWDRIISGRDKKQSEGPLGESIMSAPSVGYSEIIIKDIHSGKTNPGFTIKEYNTANNENFFKVEKTSINEDNDYFFLPLGIVNKYVNNAWVAQGFSFKMHNMHGQIKRISTYSGDYSDVHNPKTRVLSTMQEYGYYSPGDKILMWHGYDNQQQFTFENPGKEMETVFVSSKVSDIDNNCNIEFDVDIGNFGIVWIPFISIMPSLSYSEAELHTHVTTKVINYPVILKKVTTFKDQVYHLTENYAFDPLTGRPVMTKTTDNFYGLELLTAKSHDGTYTQHNIPASQQYDEMGQKAKNERTWVKTTNELEVEFIENKQYKKKFLRFKTKKKGVSLCSVLSKFVRGDLVRLIKTGTKPDSDYYLSYIGPVQGDKIELIEPVFIGGPTAPSKVDVEILRSGCTNQLTASTGNITTYGQFKVNSGSTNSTELRLRSKFVDKLNALLLSGKDGKILANEIPPGLKFIHPVTKKCAPLKEPIHLLHTKDNKIRIQIGGTTNMVDKICHSHPMVNHLNNLMNFFWRQVISDPLVKKVDLIPCTMDYEIKLPTTHNDVDYIQKAMNSYNNITPYDCVNYGKSKTIGLSMVPNSSNSSYLGNNVIFIAYKTNDPYELTSLKLTYDGRVLLEAYVQTDPANPADCIKYGVIPPKPCKGNANDLTPFFKGNFTSNIGEFSQDEKGYLTFTSKLMFSGSQATHVYNGSEGYPEIRFVKKDYESECTCSETITKSGGNGKFAVDTKKGKLVYYAGNNECFPFSVKCLQFCDDVYPFVKVTDVVESGANTYDDNWPNKYGIRIYKGEFNFKKIVNELYSSGQFGRWRIKSDYAFKTDVKGLKVPYSVLSKEKNYNTGMYTLDLFNWQSLKANDSTKWVPLNTITKYSPDGNAEEEVDILEIESAVKFGYNGTVSCLVAQNTDYNSVFFESFEKEYKDQNGNYLFENGLLKNNDEGDIDKTTAHSGTRSFKLSSNGKGFSFHKICMTDQVLKKGLLIKIWVKTKGLIDTTSIEKRKSLTTVLNKKDKKVTADFKKTAQTGEWTLYETNVKNLNQKFKLYDTLSVYINYDFTKSKQEVIWIDDLRLQPLEAQMNCYVYDVNTLRLLTSFDDQHFGLFYQYNDENQLVRKLIETERGMKTVQETQYNLPRVDRQLRYIESWLQQKPWLLEPQQRDFQLKK